MVLDVARDADAAGLGQLLHPVGDIHAVAEQVAALGHDIADIDADAELQPLGLGHRLVAPADLLLDLDGAERRFHGAGELGDHAVAGGVEHAPAMGRYHAVDDLAVAAQRRQRSLLVSLHQPAVTGHIGGKDRGKLAFHEQAVLVEAKRTKALDDSPFRMAGQPYRDQRFSKLCGISAS